MSETLAQTNPFKVFTPELMQPADVAKLFVDVFTDFPKIKDPGHTIVSGPRGCGKSMIFRFMLPDCQVIAHKASLRELPFFSVLVSIKNTCPNLTEFRRIDDINARFIMSEHVLSIFIASKVFSTLAAMSPPTDEDNANAVKNFFEDVFLDRLRMSGWCGTCRSITKDDTATTILTLMKHVCDSLYADVNQYARRLSFSQVKDVSYSGALCGYIDFLYPIMAGLRCLPFTPDGPSYLLIDDADYLSFTQTQVLNSWISTRTSEEVSIKVSTQLRYKTLSTITGIPIQSPHDYQDIAISGVYTSRGSTYMHRVRDIVIKRLDKGGFRATPEEFFPADEEQESKIKEISDRIKAEWATSGRGYRPGDDAIRYARPEYFKSLAGKAKSSHSYSYSGFQQLVDLSSNLVRYFLEAASQMYDEEVAKTTVGMPTHISQSVQDKVVRAEADKLMYDEFERIAEGEISDERVCTDSNLSRAAPDKSERLQRLLMVLGGMFRARLLSNHSERRVFSVAISGTPDPDLVEIFEFGVIHGYFHRSTIGNKDGTGRVRLYVMSRRLAPHFNLDASSFAGYQWATSAFLLKAISNPEAALRKIKQGADPEQSDSQQSLF